MGEDVIRKFLLGAVFILYFTFDASSKVLNVHDFVLENGLKVVVVSNHKAPVGLVKLYYKAGSINDPNGKGGIAHLLEHMMFRGTKKVRGQEFNTITEENGADNNAYTTYLHTGYYEFSDISKLELMLALEADRMENLKLSEEVFLKERAIVLEERMQRFETNPTTKFFESLNKFFWQKHPFSRPVSGEIEEIKNLKLEDAREFYEKYYNPSNAVLVIVGDVTVEEAKKLVGKYFAKIGNSKNIKNDTYQYVLDKNKSDLVMKIDGVLQPRFVGYWHLDSKMFSKKEILALEFLMEFLFGDDTSYMIDKLVYKDKKYLSVDGGVDYDEKHGGKISFYIVPKDSSLSINEIKNDLNENLREGIDKICNQDVERIKNETLSNVVYMLENPTSIAGFVGGLILDGFNVDAVENYDEMIKSISKEDIISVWKKVDNLDKKEVYGMIEI